MNLVLYSDKIDEYLKYDNVIDYGHEAIAELGYDMGKKEIRYIQTDN